MWGGGHFSNLGGSGGFQSNDFSGVKGFGANDFSGGKGFGANDFSGGKGFGANDFSGGKGSTSLEPDIKPLRGFSDRLDNSFGGGPIYEKAVRPVIHGVYHAGRGFESGNAAEIARAKDQFSKIGTGEQRPEYLKAHQEAAASATTKIENADTAK